MDKKKKDRKYFWIAFVLSLFAWVPLLNIFFFIPVAIFFAVKQILRARKDSETYGGKIISIILLAWLLVLVVLAIIGYYASQQYMPSA